MSGRDYYLLKIVLVGDERVGKSAWTSMACKAQFIEEYKATIGVDFQTTLVNFSDHQYRMQVWDSGGQKRFRAITSTYFRGASGIVLCYSVTDRSSFESLPQWAVQVNEKSSEGVSVVVMGLKADLESERQVSTAEGREFAKKIGTAFIEVSSKTGENAQNVFTTIISAKDGPDVKSAGAPARVVAKEPTAVVVGEPGSNAPLLAIEMEATIIRNVAAVAVVQRFRNREEEPIEGVFVWPIDRRAAICGLTATFEGGRTVVAKLKKKETAQAEHSEAMAAGRRAAEAEESADGSSLCISLGVLKPGEHVDVRVEIVTELVALDPTTLKFLFPLSGLSPTDARAAASSSTSSAKFRGKIQIEGTRGMKNVECFSHRCDIDSKGIAEGRAVVTIAETSIPSPDVDVHIAMGDLSQPGGVSQVTAGNELAVAVSFAPSFPELFSECTFTIILDRSGSMSGSKWNQAQRAADLFLKSLPRGVHFNVIGFGSTFETMFGESVSLDERNVSIATKKIASWSANLGGTNMAPPLEQAGRMCAGSTIGMIILVTDGNSGDEEQVLKFISAGAGARIFPLGIGGDVNKVFLTRVATETKGKPKFIESGSRIEAAVIEQLAEAVHIEVAATIDWGLLSSFPEFKCSPLPENLFVKLGLLNTAFAVCKLPSAGSPNEAKVTATVEIGKFRAAGSADVRITAPVAGQTTLLHQLAARRIHRESAGKPGESEAVELCLRHHVLCPALGFIAVGDVTGEAMTETPVLREVQLRFRHRADQFAGELPVFNTRGLLPGSIQTVAEERASRGVICLSAMDSAPKDAGGACCGGGGSWSSSPSSYTRPPSPPAPPAAAAPPITEGQAQPASSDRRLFDSLLSHIRTDGSFSITEEQAKDLKIESGVVSNPPTGVSKEAWTTAIALAVLEARHSDLRGEWSLVWEKAIGWLAKVLPAEMSASRCIHEAKLALKL